MKNTLLKKIIVNNDINNTKDIQIFILRVKFERDWLTHYRKIMATIIPRKAR